MKLRPTTRHFLVSAGVVALVFIVIIGRYLWGFFNAIGAESEAAMQGILIDGAFFGLVLVLGIGFAWFRLLRDRAERRKRKPPLTLG